MKKIIQLLLISFAVFMFGSPAMAIKLDFGGEIRFRYDQNDNQDLSDSEPDYQTSVQQLVRLNARVVVDERTTAFFSIQDSRVWGEEGSVTNTADEKESADLDEAWLGIKNAVGLLNVKIGRQRLAYGSGRLIADSPWSNHGKRFDGIKLFYHGEDLDLDIFFTKTKTSEDGNSNSNVDDHFHGLYTSLKKVVPATVLDLYALQKKVDDPTAKFHGQDLVTIGAYLNGDIDSFDWSAEYAEQSGRLRKTANGEIKQDANFYALTAGYTFSVESKMRFGGELIKGGGDRLGTDDRSEQFQSLYPSSHYHYGMSDISVQEIKESERISDLKAYNFNFAMNPFKKVKFKTSYWNFAKENTTEKYGEEVNFQVWYELTPSSVLYAYHAVYNPSEKSGTNTFKRTVVQVHTKF